MPFLACFLQIIEAFHTSIFYCNRLTRSNVGGAGAASARRGSGAIAVSARHGSGVIAACDGRQRGAGAASLRRERGVSTARELRHCCMREASARRGSGVSAA